MSEGDAGRECGSDVFLPVQGELLQADPGLLALSSVCGVFTGLLTAALLLHFCIKPLILTRQGYNIRRLLEPQNADLEKSPSGVSSDKNDGPSITEKPEKNVPHVSRDVAAFATRAKVVYPINQKYRPLADGASNPSLHESTCVPLSTELPSCSCSDEDSDENNDCEGQNGYGHFASSVLPQSLQNYSFTPVSNRALTLTLTGVENRVNLCFLALRDVQQNYVYLQEEKDLMYSLIMKTFCGSRFPKNKQDSDFWRTLLQLHEKELSESSFRTFIPLLSSPEEREHVTFEEIERSQKELLEHGLHSCKRFSKQVEDLSQSLLRNTSIFHLEEAQEIISSISKTLLLLEAHLQRCQDSLLSAVHEKLLWWQEFTALLQTQLVLLKREASLRQSLVSRALEQMTSDGVLTFSQMEKILHEVQDIQNNGLKQLDQECVRKTFDLATEKMSQMESKRKKMLKNQSKDRRVLEQPQTDLEGAFKVYEELALKHMQQLKGLETQQEVRLTNAITELWTSLRSSWALRLANQCRSLLLSSLSSESSLTQDKAEQLWSDLEQALSLQLHEAEISIREQLQETSDRLHREGQTWREEMTLVKVCLTHVSDNQLNALQALELRQSYTLRSQVGRLLTLKHLHLMGALRRLLVIRHISLNLLKEMRLSKLSALSESDGTCTPCGEKDQDTAAVQSSSNVATQMRLTEEHHLMEQSIKQEFLSELETGAELLQHHLQTILGNALSHSIQQEMEREPQELCSDPQDSDMKCRLTEAASESVYLTKDSLTDLVQKYYSQLQRITGQLQQEPARLSDDEEEPEQSRAQIMTSLLKELKNWSRKPNSAEFQQRVEQHKSRLLAQTDREHRRLWEGLRRRKITRDITLDKVKDQLMEAEEVFIEDLATLARVSVPKEESKQREEPEDITSPSVNIRELLALNPALDPAVNPSLTPLVSAPVKIVLRDQKKTT